MKTRFALFALVGLAAAAFATYRVFIYAAPLETVAATESVVPARVTGPGTVQGRNPVTLSARVTASIAKLHADQGDVVRRGQILAQLDDRDLVAKRGSVAGQRETQLRNVKAAQANLAKAQAELELARSKYRRDADLFAKGYVSQLSFDASRAALRTAESVLENGIATLAAREAEGGTLVQEARYADTLISFTRIVAPMDGVIVQRLSETGNTVVPGSPIFRMVDPIAIWVATRVDESMVARLRVGMPASIRLRTGETLPGKVARIAWQSDAATRELEVDVAFDVPPARFAIDQEAEVTISTGDEKGMVVPVAALLQYQGKQGVLVVRDGRARFQGVQTGAADATNIVIRKGLAAGDAVVVAPLGVKPGSRVRSLAAPG